MSELFPSKFLAAIERLSIDVRAPLPSVAPGGHLSRSPGSSLDFRDFRNYSLGDDLRRVDWNVYRRSGHLFLRRFDHPTQVPVYVLIDTSESMFVEDPPRSVAAARVAAAIAGAVVHGHDDVQMMPFSDRAPRPLQRISHRQRLPEVMEYLSSLRPGGPGTLRNAAEVLRRYARRSGLAVIISDFFEDAGVEGLIRSLSDIQHRLVLVQITQAGDADPQLSEEAELIDCETARSAPVFPTRHALDQYREAYRQYHAELSAFADKRRCAHVRIDASDDILAQLERLFPAGVLRVAEALP